MSAVRLPLPIGLRIESILSKGITKEKLISALNNNNYEGLLNKGAEENELAILFRYAEEHQLQCISAIEQGYEFKFLTIRGLKNFLILKYGLEEGTDLLFKETYLDQVKLKKDWLVDIEKTITSYWSYSVLTEDTNKGNVLVRFHLAHSSSLLHHS